MKGSSESRTIPRPTIPRPTIPRPDNSQNGQFPDRQFPEWTIPRTDNSPINEEMTGEISCFLIKMAKGHWTVKIYIFVFLIHSPTLDNGDNVLLLTISFPPHARFICFLRKRPFQWFSIWTIDLLTSGYFIDSHTYVRRGFHGAFNAWFYDVFRNIYSHKQNCYRAYEDWIK